MVERTNGQNDEDIYKKAEKADGEVEEGKEETEERKKNEIKTV